MNQEINGMAHFAQQCIFSSQEYIPNFSQNQNYTSGLITCLAQLIALRGMDRVRNPDEAYTMAGQQEKL